MVEVGSGRFRCRSRAASPSACRSAAAGRARPVAPATGTLTIATNPPGATAVIDGKPSGTTPVTLTLLTGSHTVELRGVGRATVDARDDHGRRADVAVHRPPEGLAIVGQLNVRTEPAGATVTVDGVRRGVTPMIVTDLTPGDHVVALDGDAGSVKQNVTIESGCRRPSSCRWERLPRPVRRLDGSA